MTTPEIAGLCERLREALEGVTPGPWDDTMGRSGLRIIEGDSGCPVASYVSEKDAAFIALSREAAPVLLDTIERQAAEIERLRGALGEAMVGIERIARIHEQPGLETAHDAKEWAHCAAIVAMCGHKVTTARAALTGEDAGGTG